MYIFFFCKINFYVVVYLSSGHFLTNTPFYLKIITISVILIVNKGIMFRLTMAAYTSNAYEEHKYKR